MKIGVLTGGGDCPGLNAVIRAIVRKGTDVKGDKVFGFYDAWDGVLEQRYIDLKTSDVRGPTFFDALTSNDSKTAI